METLNCTRNDARAESTEFLDGTSDRLIPFPLDSGLDIFVA